MKKKNCIFFLYSFTFQVMLLISKKHVSKHFKFIFIYFHLFNQNMGRFISSSFSLRFLLFYFFFLFFWSHNFLAFSFLFSQFPHFIFLFYDLKKIICDHFFSLIRFGLHQNDRKKFEIVGLLFSSNFDLPFRF